MCFQAQLSNQVTWCKHITECTKRTTECWELHQCSRLSLSMETWRRSEKKEEQIWSGLCFRVTHWWKLRGGKERKDSGRGGVKFERPWVMFYHLTSADLYNPTFEWKHFNWFIHHWDPNRLCVINISLILNTKRSGLGSSHPPDLQDLLHSVLQRGENMWPAGHRSTLKIWLMIMF